MRVLMFGSRDWADPTPINDAIVQIMEEHGTLALVHGDARGADRMAAGLAKRHGFLPIAVPADWDTHGKAAGGIRNQLMIDEHLLPFAADGITARGFRLDGPSAGTDDMLRRLKAAGIHGTLKRGRPGVVTPVQWPERPPSLNRGEPYELWPEAS